MTNDPFLNASPTYRNAVRTCQKSGPAYEESGRSGSIRSMLLAAAVFAAIVAVAVMGVG